MNNRLNSLEENLFSYNQRLAMLFLQNNLLTDSDLSALEKATNLEYL